MNRRDTVRVEQIDRVGGFLERNAADFTALPPAAKTNLTALAKTYNQKDTGLIARLEAFKTGRETGSIDYHGGTVTKATLRDGIVLDLADWHEAAATIASETGNPGMMKGFTTPHGGSAEEFVGKVRAICTHAESYEDAFLALAFEEDFIEDMRERVIAFEEAADDQSGGLQGQTGARGGLSATIREGVLAGRKANVILKKLYKDDPAKRTAWATAYHTERVGTSGKKRPTTPPPTT